MSANDLPKVYDAQPVEIGFARWWVEKGYFQPPAASRQRLGARGPFCIVIPPPNITGALHIGHALDVTIQDVLIRWRRMQGYEALWLPGTDHAGIATQNVVERELADKGVSRQELGRERFEEEVWRWKESAHGEISQQLQRLGASCDWSRERFTLDEGCSRAVRHAFAELYREGLIYRGERMINWCPRCATALSDIEVDHKEVEGKLYYIRYPLEESRVESRESRVQAPDSGLQTSDSGGRHYLVVATTRPETMLGDTAVAASPADERHSSLAGRRAILPLVGRGLPIIFDDAVDPEFGTGLVKITPAHDPDDLQIGLKHALPQEVVIGPEAKMTESAGKYAGLDRYEARERILEDLQELGLLEKVEPHVHSVGHCQRCGTAIEPMVSLQWFVKMEPLAQLGAEAVRSGKVRFVPERWEKVYLDWMDNSRDWCISRQLWWGHRIPVWYCQQCGEENVGEKTPSHCRRCGSEELAQDEDVLDTWFSSALWPFSTLGWPEKTEDLGRFYPTSVLVTAYDIIFFWVARMIFMGMKLMGQEPFREVWIHGLVRDPKGRKMSKSEGNVVDPLETVERFSADALRYALASACSLGQDLRLTEQRLIGARNFCNKIWNAARFVLQQAGGRRQQAGGSEQESGGGEVPAACDLQPAAWSLGERWIMSRLQRAIGRVTEALEGYRLDEACQAVYEFFWSEFCDWYIEISKIPRQQVAGGSQQAAAGVLHHCLRTAMQLLHPIMPFITEEVWQRLNETEAGSAHAESICVTPWPEVKEEWIDEEAEREMGYQVEAVSLVRGHRVTLGLEPAQIEEVLVDSQPLLELLGSSQLADWSPSLAAAPRYRVVADIRIGEDALYFQYPWNTYGPSGIRVALRPKKGADVASEWERQLGDLRKQLMAATAALAASEARLKNQAFLSRARPEAVEKEKKKEAEFRQRVGSLRERIRQLEDFAKGAEAAGD